MPLLILGSTLGWLTTSSYIASKIVPEYCMTGDVPLVIWPSMIIFWSGIYGFYRLSNLGKK